MFVAKSTSQQLSRGPSMPKTFGYQLSISGTARDLFYSGFVEADPFLGLRFDLFIFIYWKEYLAQSSGCLI